MAWGQRAGVQDLLDRLSQPATAKSLYVLSTRKITEADAKRLAESIAVNTQLEELYLSGHRLGQEGLQAFADCVAVNTTLKHLCVGEDSLGDEGVKVLCDGIARNANSGLQTWDLEHKSIALAGAAAIGKLLETNTTLHTLTISRNALGDGAVGEFLAGLRANPQPTLKHLLATDIGITGAALDHFASLLKVSTCSLESLQLSFNGLDSATTAFFDALASNMSLKKLHLKDCKLNDTQAEALGNALKQNATLEEIDLSDNCLTSVACAALAEGLKKNTALKSLNLGNNKCQDAGAILIGEALAANASTSKLAYLDLSKNELTHAGIIALIQSSSVKELHAFNNTIGAGLHELLPVLTANHCIEHLDVGANQLHGTLSIALFDAIHNHPTLKTLEMGGNSLGEDGHEALDRLRQANRDLDVAVDKNAQDENGNFNFEK
ncbi:Lrr-containing protein, partial [Globisporangium splendens]